MRSSQRGNIIPILSDDSDEENDIMVLPEIDIGQSYRTAEVGRCFHSPSLWKHICYL